MDAYLAQQFALECYESLQSNQNYQAARQPQQSVPQPQTVLIGQQNEQQNSQSRASAYVSASQVEVDSSEMNVTESRYNSIKDIKKVTNVAMQAGSLSKKVKASILQAKLHESQDQANSQHHNKLPDLERVIPAAERVFTKGNTDDNGDLVVQDQNRKLYDSNDKDSMRVDSEAAQVRASNILPMAKINETVSIKDKHKSLNAQYGAIQGKIIANQKK